MPDSKKLVKKSFERTEPFDREKIASSIRVAALACNRHDVVEVAGDLAGSVSLFVEKCFYKKGETPTTNDLAHMVYAVLSETEYESVAKVHAGARQLKGLIRERAGMEVDPLFYKAHKYRIVVNLIGRSMLKEVHFAPSLEITVRSDVPLSDEHTAIVPNTPLELRLSGLDLVTGMISERDTFKLAHMAFSLILAKRFSVHQQKYGFCVNGAVYEPDAQEPSQKGRIGYTGHVYITP